MNDYQILNLILTVILLAISIIIIVPMVIAFLYGAPWVPTSKYTISKMIKAAKLKKGDVIMDPGCGDGRILFSAMREQDGLKARGYEMFFFVYIFGKLKSLFMKDVDIFYKDSRKVDMSDINTLFCYMLPATLKKLGVIWKKKMSSDAQVISYAFEIAGWKIFKKIERVPEKNQAPIYVYRLQDQK